MSKTKSNLAKTAVFAGIFFIFSVITTIIENALGWANNTHILEYILPQALVSITLGPLIYWTYRFLKWAVTYMLKN